MWFGIGLITGIILLLLIFWIRSRNITVRWYEWLIATIGYILLLFALQNFIASSAEFEPVAPGMFLLIFGLPGLILLLLALTLVCWRRHKVSSKLKSDL